MELYEKQSLKFPEILSRLEMTHHVRKSAQQADDVTEIVDVGWCRGALSQILL